MYVDGATQPAQASRGAQGGAATPPEGDAGEEAQGSPGADVEAAIAAIVDASPPLTATQRARLAVLLQGGQGACP